MPLTILGSPPMSFAVQSFRIILFTDCMKRPKCRGKFAFCVPPMIILDFLADNQAQLSAGICPNNPNRAPMVM